MTVAGKKNTDYHQRVPQKQARLVQTDSDQFPAAEFPLTFPVAGADRFQKRMELTAVIHVTQMAKFMEYHIIPQFGGKTHQIEIQIDISQNAATPPIAHIMLYTHLPCKRDPGLQRQFPEPAGQIGFRRRAQLSDFLGFLQLTARARTASSHYPHPA